MYAAYNDVILRTPIFSIENLETQNDISGTLLELLKNDIFSKGIHLASPDLYQKAKRWQSGKLTDQKEIEKVVSSLYRYYVRMCSRPTPFGFFAGCAILASNDSTDVTLSTENQHSHRSRLDMNYVCELSVLICETPDIKCQLTYYVNNSLFKIGDTYRYVEYIIHNKHRSYVSREVTAIVQLERVLLLAQNGCQFSLLVSSIIDNSISEGEALDFVNELISSKILISELDPAITGQDCLSRLIHKLEALEGTAALTAILTEIASLLINPSFGIPEFNQVLAHLKKLLPNTTHKNLIQTDLYLSTQSQSINKAITDSIVRQTEALIPLITLYTPERVKVFKDNFLNRYETQEVPLLIALDSEMGVGYDNHTNSNTDQPEILQGIDISVQSEKSTLISWNKSQHLKLEMLKSSIKAGLREIELSDPQIRELGKFTETVQMPDSSYILGSVVSSSEADLDKADYKFLLRHAYGSSAGAVLGRFCQEESELTDKVRGYLADEDLQNPDCIYAEIVHLPQARVGNVISRPILRRYEIPYLGSSGLPREMQIEASDILVSVRNGSIILRSKKFNRRIIPKMNNAHNYVSHSLPVYKFLCDCQNGASVTSTETWDWGVLNQSAFLPRIVYKNIILKRAQWSLSVEPSESSNSILNTLNKFITENSVPRKVQLVETDHELLLDLEDSRCKKLLIKTLKKKRQATLVEFLFESQNCFVKNFENRKFVNEIIIPLKKVSEHKSYGALNTLSPAAKDQDRIFLLGSEWLYIKIYCGTSSAERLLTDVLKPTIDDLSNRKLIDKWFFLRYSESGHHLRLRFHGKGDFWQHVLKILSIQLEPFLQKRIVYKFQIDTYFREVERYGIVDMKLSESLFWIDSECVMNFLQLLNSDDGEKFRWLFALRGVNQLLEDFQFSTRARSQLASEMFQSFAMEFGQSKLLTVQLDASYRNKSKFIRSHMNPDYDHQNQIAEAGEIFKNRSTKLKETLNGIDNELRQFDSSVIRNLIKSYVHMFLNRLLMSNQRKQELVVYYFLTKFYASELAIEKKKTQSV